MKEHCAAGFVVISKGKWLLCHPTGITIHWDLPKGNIEEGENPQQAATRELQEETGIKLSTLEIMMIRDFGRFPYQDHRDLHLFGVNLPNLDISKLHCSSMVAGKKPFPEMDDFKLYTTNQVFEKVTPRIRTILESNIFMKLKEMKWIPYKLLSY